MTKFKHKNMIHVLFFLIYQIIIKFHKSQSLEYYLSKFVYTRLGFYKTNHFNTVNN